MADKDKDNIPQSAVEPTTKTADKAAAKAEPVKQEVTDVQLPPALTLSKAAGIAGARNAQSFFDEVSMVAWGNLSDHMTPTLDFHGLQLAADDPADPYSETAKRYLTEIQKIANEYASKK